MWNSESLGQLHAQRTAASLVTALGKPFQIPVATAPTEDANNGHQQQKPLGIPDTSALAPIRQGLQKFNQVSAGRRLTQA
jgi:hypothetical protein